MVDSAFSSNLAYNGDDVYVRSAGVLRIAEGTSGASSDDMKYNDIFMASGATVFKGCKAGQGGKLNVQAPGGSQCSCSISKTDASCTASADSCSITQGSCTATASESASGGGNIGGYKTNFPVDNMCKDQNNNVFNCNDCSACADGTISAGAQTSCTLCPPGTHSNVVHTECISCEKEKDGAKKKLQVRLFQCVLATCAQV